MPGFVKRHHEYECIHTGLGYKAVHRFAKFCSCCCLPLLPAFAYSIHTTWGPPFSRVMQKQVQKRAPFFVFTLLSRPSLHIPPHKSHATKMQQICESGSKAHLQSESPTGLMFSSFQPGSHFYKMKSDLDTRSRKSKELTLLINYCYFL